MIRLQLKLSGTPLEDALWMLETAVRVEFGTLPPYLYALFSIPSGENVEAAARIRSIAMQEMIHMCLVCNIANALGTSLVMLVPTYPGPLPGDIGPPGGEPLIVRLLPFSKEAMAQAMAIERPEDPPDFPIHTALLKATAPKSVTIGQFYAALDYLLSTLPADKWTPGYRQIDDSQFFQGQLFAINNYEDAHRAISEIVSEGEGAKNDPLDFQHEVAHYYRFAECFHDRVLTKADTPLGYQFGPKTLGIDWKKVYPAIADPAQHDFAHDGTAAQLAQIECTIAFSKMVEALQKAVMGDPAQLGIAVQRMFDLRTAAQVAMTTPLHDPSRVAGPSFVYVPPPILSAPETGASS